MIELIEKIAERAVKISNNNLDKIDIMMDLTYCIEGGCNLRLNAMFNSNDFDLMHDIYGISRHLDHSTYKLKNGFWPRFAGKE